MTVLSSDSHELKIKYFQSLFNFLILPKEYATGVVLWKVFCLTCTDEGNGDILKLMTKLSFIQQELIEYLSVEETGGIHK